MKMNHFILMALFCLTVASLFKYENSFAFESPRIEQGADSDQENPDQEDLIKPVDGKEGDKLQESAEPLQPEREPQEKGNPGEAIKQNVDKKPLDLTFKPDFPDNPRWNDQFNSGSQQRYQDWFDSRNKNRKLELKGEFLRSFEIEEEKFKPIDGAGIRIELNTE